MTNSSHTSRVGDWVKIIGAVCAVLTLVLGAYRVSWGPDSIESQLREAEVRDDKQLCAEGVGVVSALASSIHDSTLAPQVKLNFLNLYNGRIKLLDRPALDSTFNRVHERYQDEEHSRGDFAPERSSEQHEAAYARLEGDLRGHAERVALECKRLR